MAVDYRSGARIAAASSLVLLAADASARPSAIPPAAGQPPLAGRHLPQGAQGGRIVPVAAIIAVAVTTTEGKREIVGLHIGPSEAEPFWSTFLRDLVRRGLKG